MRREGRSVFVGSPPPVLDFVALFPRVSAEPDAARRCACGCSPSAHRIDGNKVVCATHGGLCGEVFGLGEFAAMASRWAGGQR